MVTKVEECPTTADIEEDNWKDPDTFEADDGKLYRLGLDFVVIEVNNSGAPGTPGN